MQKRWVCSVGNSTEIRGRPALECWAHAPMCPAAPTYPKTQQQKESPFWKPKWIWLLRTHVHVMHPTQNNYGFQTSYSGTKCKTKSPRVTKIRLKKKNSCGKVKIKIRQKVLLCAKTIIIDFAKITQNPNFTNNPILRTLLFTQVHHCVTQNKLPLCRAKTTAFLSFLLITIQYVLRTISASVILKN